MTDELCRRTISAFLLYFVDVTKMVAFAFNSRRQIILIAAAQPMFVIFLPSDFFVIFRPFLNTANDWAAFISIARLIAVFWSVLDLRVQRFRRRHDESCLKTWRAE